MNREVEKRREKPLGYIKNSTGASEAQRVSASSATSAISMTAASIASKIGAVNAINAINAMSALGASLSRPRHVQPREKNILFFSQIKEREKMLTIILFDVLTRRG
jgi:hypothetical protein